MEDRPPRIIKVKKVPGSEHKERREEVLEMLARFCYLYPQYTLRAARALPSRHVKMMMRIAETMKALDYINLLQISIAPHTKNGAKKLLEHYTKITNTK